jgi:hypothetical protein
MDEQLIIEIWDTFKDYVPEKNRETLANQFVEFLLNKDTEMSNLEGVLGYDSYLDIAIQSALDEYQEENEIENPDDDWDYEDEE